MGPIWFCFVDLHKIVPLKLGEITVLFKIKKCISRARLTVRLWQSSDFIIYVGLINIKLKGICKKRYFEKRWKRKMPKGIDKWEDRGIKKTFFKKWNFID